jgi:hypothetical protein
MHHTDPSRTQALSLQLVEKIFQLYEQNEKLVHFRYGESNFYSRPNQRMCTSIFLFLFLCFIIEVQQGQPRNQGTGGGSGGGGGGSGQNWSKAYIIILLSSLFFFFLFNRSNSKNRNKSSLLKYVQHQTFFIFTYLNLSFAVLFLSIFVVDLSR